MMKLLLIVSTLLISYVYGQQPKSKCGIKPIQNGRPIPVLGVQATNSVNGNSEGRFYASIHTGEERRGTWSPWRLIDNARCDDFEPGKMSYFDDFVRVRDDWDAIAIYACTEDGVAIERISYWNGRATATTEAFDEGVFGPFGKRCLKNAFTRKDPRDGSTVYSDIWIDGGRAECDGIVFRTGNLGTIWTGKLPAGPPRCTTSELRGAIKERKPVRAMTDGLDNFMPEQQPVIPDNNTSGYTQFEQQLLNYLMGVIGIALLLFVSNSCLMAYAIKNRNGGSSNYYGKVAQTDIE